MTTFYYLVKEKMDEKGYTLRSLSKEMNVSAQYLSEVLNGKKYISNKILKSIKEILNPFRIEEHIKPVIKHYKVI